MVKLGNCDNCDVVKDIVLLGYPNIKDGYDLFALLSPYTNELLNIITITITKPYFKFSIYPHEPTNFKQKLLRDVIDLVAIFGIIANASKDGEKQGERSGLISGIIMTIFGFFIPNIIMYALLKKVKKNYMKFIVGILVIYILDVCANLTYCLHLCNKDDKVHKRFSS